MTCIDLHDMVFGKNDKSFEKEDILDKKPFGVEQKPFSFAHRIIEVRETNRTLKVILEENMKNDLRANKSVMRKRINKKDLTKNNKKSFFHTILGYTKIEYTKETFTS